MTNEIFEKLQANNYEELIFFNDTETKLKVIIAIHSTINKKAFGGCRFYDYKNEQLALEDALKLSKAMTYKNAASELQYGGAKCVIIGDPNKIKNQKFLTKLASCLNGLHSKYILGKDLGMTGDDIAFLRTKSNYVSGTERDVSFYTAYGIIQGMKAAIKFKFGEDEKLAGKTIAIQGVGDVGSYLVELLTKEECNILVSDVDQTRINKISSKFPVKVISNDEILEQKCDILAPCATGGIINQDTIPNLNCAIIAGGANNQLKNETKDAQLLMEKNILFAPDYLINVGGAIAFVAEIENLNEKNIYQKCDGIKERLLSVLKLSKEKSISIIEAANFLTELNLKKIQNI